MNSVLTVAAFLAGVGFAIFGFMHTSLSLPWDGRGALIRYFGYLLLCMSLVLSTSVVWKKSPIIIGAILATLVAVLAGALWPLLVVAWFSLAAILLGQYFLSSIKVARLPAWAPLLTGAALYGTATGLLAHFRVNFPGIYGLGLLLPIALRWRVVLENFQQFRNQVSTPWLRPHADLWFESAIVTVGLVLFIVALMPELGFDALAMHMFVPAQLLARHQWGFDATTYVWAVMPMLGDWIFSIGYILAGETAARLTNVGFIFLLCWLVRDLVLWAGGKVSAVRWAVLIFISTPLTFTESSSLFIESVWASFIVAGTLTVLKVGSDTENRKSNLIIAGLFLGCALATKAVTFPVLVVLLLVLIWRYKMWFASGMAKPLIIGLGLFLLFGSVPYITAWWLTGNPVFPFFNQVFQSPLWPLVNFDASAQGKGLTWDFIYGVTFQSGKYLEARAGAGGFQWLLVFLPVSAILILARHRRGISLIVLGILTIALVFHSTAYLRYIFPVYVVLAAAMGVGLAEASSQTPVLARMLSGVAVLAIILNIAFMNAGAAYGDFPLKSITSEEHRGRYLASRLPIRSAVALVNSLNVDVNPVAVFADPLTAGLKSDALFANWYNHTWQGAYFAAQSENTLISMLLEKNVNLLIVDTNWNASGNVSKEQLFLIDKISTKVSQSGSVAVRRLNDNIRLNMDSYRFKNELLVNPDFSEIKGWSLHQDVRYNGNLKTIVASSVVSGAQSVHVKAGQRYRNTVIARCYKGKTQGRIQVNWSDGNGQFIRPDIQVFDCTRDWQEHSMEVTAPPNAVNATVYAAGHTAIPLEFKSVSLKQ